ncbi:MAG: DUF4405 domain-containing protein [Phycisphaerales bacterium]|nr:DUF4405 domain-containing protein [Phycisphaerales bacterium]
MAKRMSRSAINFSLDLGAFVVLLATLWTRLVTFWIVPPPAEGKSGLALWGMNHKAWDAVNFWVTMAFAVVILVHLILHWTWISQFVHQRVKRRSKSVAVLDSGTQTVYGVGFMIVVFVVVGGLLAVAAVAAKPF